MHHLCGAKVERRTIAHGRCAITDNLHSVIVRKQMGAGVNLGYVLHTFHPWAKHIVFVNKVEAIFKSVETKIVVFTFGIITVKDHLVLSGKTERETCHLLQQKHGTQRCL